MTTNTFDSFFKGEKLVTINNEVLWDGYDLGELEKLVSDLSSKTNEDEKLSVMCDFILEMDDFNTSTGIPFMLGTDKLSWCEVENVVNDFKKLSKLVKCQDLLLINKACKMVITILKSNGVQEEDGG